MVSDEALKKLQEQIAAWPMAQRFVVQQLIEDYRRNREDLRAYKATGLKPEEVLPKDKADEIALKLMRLADLESLCNYTRLRELAEADKDGRLVVLPCKVGDTVYMISWRLNGRHEIEERVFSLTYFDPAKYGKDYFLSREEAEKALEAMKGV
jgi:hypothetical protein